MRSLPIAKAFLNPFASSCRGSSTLGFVRLVTESDCRRPRNVGVRQEDVRVSVRAVDMLAFFGGRGVGRLRIWVYSTAQPSSPLAEGVEWLGSRLRLAVDRARRLCLAWVRRRLASMCETRFGQLPLLHCVDREAPQPRIDPPSQLPQTSPATML